MAMEVDLITETMLIMPLLLILPAIITSTSTGLNPEPGIDKPLYMLSHLYVTSLILIETLQYK